MIAGAKIWAKGIVLGGRLAAAGGKWAVGASKAAIDADGKVSREELRRLWRNEMPPGAVRAAWRDVWADDE